MDTDSRASFASLLKEYRVAQGLSQEALAERAGLSREAINLLERGRRLRPRRDTVLSLARTLNLSPSERSRLLAAAAAPGRHPIVATGATSGRPSSLPPRLTSFIGREHEIAEVQELLLSKRLVTLTGTGGIGKTSLAREVAAAVQAHFADGVALAALATLTDEDLVPHAIATAVGVPERPGEPILTTLATALGPTRRLLLLDNCEHLALSCAHVAETLLQACPRLQLLVTSRESLRVGAEVIWRVPALGLPDDDVQPLDVLARSEAVRLFVERAEAVRPGFALDMGNAAAVVEICRRLDGMPLAIELAAARVSALTPEQIARHLNDRFRLLTTGSRTALPRHQTLRALIDWSHDLLAEPERVLFRRLSVFVGGWSLEAAEAVGAGAGIDQLEVLDLLTQLLARSLVQVAEHAGEERFRLLETLRQYGWERLEEAGELATIRDRHLDWFLRVAERAKPELIGPEQVVWLDRLEREHDNLRAALRWAAECGSTEPGLRLTGALGRLWHVGDHLNEGREWLARTLEAPGALAPTVARADVLDAACELALYQDDYAAARCLGEEGLAIYRALDDRRGIAWALCQLAQVANKEGEVARAEELGLESLKSAREAGARWVAARALETLGLAALERGDLPLAQCRLAESVATFRALGDHRGIASALEYLGWVSCIQGDNRAARTCFEEALRIARALGSKVQIRGLRGWLGLVATVEGDYGVAHALYEESLTLARQQGDRGAIGLGLYRQGLLARAEGDFRNSLRLARESLAVCRDVNMRVLLTAVFGLVGMLAIERGSYPLGVRLLGRGDAGPTGSWWQLPDERRAVEASVSAARAALGENDFATTWAAGQAMTLEAAVELALAKGDREAPG